MTDHEITAEFQPRGRRDASPWRITCGCGFEVRTADHRDLSDIKREHLNDMEENDR